ncbi:MAG: hypothetical protein RPR97_02350 [Colwellia sp.]
MNSIKKYFIVIFVALAVSGCGPEAKEKPEDVAIAFFDAIYNEKDINKAKKLCTANLAKEIGKHVTTKNVARRLFNMSFDSVKVDTALGEREVRGEFKNSEKLTILFTGYRRDKTYKELKRIKLIKQGDAWLIAEFLRDPSPY